MSGGGELRSRFASVSAGGLDRESFPFRLWEKSKRLGVWNPADVDLERDRADWGSLDEGRRDVLLRLMALFQAGEEAKHVDAFRRFFDDVARHAGDLSHYHTPAYRELFYRELPHALAALDEDPAPAAQARASVTYHMIVELFDAYETVPFGLELDEFLGYAMGQFRKRSERIERARGLSLEEVRRSFDA